MPPPIHTDGNLTYLIKWYEKTLAAFEEIDLPSSRDYNDEWIEVSFNCWFSSPLFITLGLHQKLAAL